MSDVLHHARTTPTQQASIEHRARFRANIDARAEASKAKIIPIVCLDKPRAVPVMDMDKVFGPRIVSEIDMAFGPVVHRDLPDPRRPTIKLIVRAAANFYDVSVDDILSARREMHIVKPRQVAMYLSRVMTLKATPEIGRCLGDKDHTTVLHGANKIREQVKTDPRLADEIEVLKLHIREAALNLL